MKIKVRMLRGYRGWRTDEKYFAPDDVVDVDKGLADYLVDNEYAVYQYETHIKKHRDNEMNVIDPERISYYEELDYRELQSLCKRRGLKANGKTEELIERLVNDHH